MYARYLTMDAARSISVIMPARNAQAYIAESIRGILHQSGCNLELIIVDDKSTDRTGEIARDVAGSKARIVNGPGEGISRAMNLGVGIATGEYIARCDADDIFPQDRLQRQEKWLSEHPEFIAICGGFSTISGRGKLLMKMPTGLSAQEITEEVINGKPRTHLGTFLIRANAIRQIGGFRDWFLTAEDIDLQLRLAEIGRIWYEPADWYHYRIHDESITHNIDSARRKFFDEQAVLFQQQRRRSGTDELQRGSPPMLPEKSDDALKAREHRWNLMVGAAWSQDHQSRTASLKAGLRVCMAEPWRWGSWRNLGALAIKGSAIKG